MNLKVYREIIGLETRKDIDGNADTPTVGAGIGGISIGAGEHSKL